MLFFIITQNTAEANLLAHEPHTFVPYKLLDLDGEEFCEDLRGSKDLYHGQLTSVGAQQLFDLGCQLRSCYKDQLMISDEYSEEVFIRSTKMKRTVESARSLLSGFNF